LSQGFCSKFGRRGAERFAIVIFQVWSRLVASAPLLEVNARHGSTTTIFRALVSKIVKM
jgi:hypothetical protein